MSVQLPAELASRYVKVREGFSAVVQVDIESLTACRGRVEIMDLGELNGYLERTTRIFGHASCPSVSRPIGGSLYSLTAWLSRDTQLWGDHYLWRYYIVFGVLRDSGQ